MAMILVLAFVLGVVAASAQTAAHPVIEVSGTSSLSIVPDRITVEIGLEEYFVPSGDADSVKVGIRTIENDVRRALNDVGVADSQINVADIGNYSDRGASARFLMAKRLSAVLADFSQLDEVAGNLPEFGVTSFNIAKLDNSDMARYNDMGLKSALDAARAKAEFIAGNEKLSGLTVWKVEETTPPYTSSPQAFSNVAYAAGSGMAGMRSIERIYSVRVTYVILSR